MSLESFVHAMSLLFLLGSITVIAYESYLIFKISKECEEHCANME